MDGIGVAELVFVCNPNQRLRWDPLLTLPDDCAENTDLMIIIFFISVNKVVKPWWVVSQWMCTVQLTLAISLEDSIPLWDAQTWGMLVSELHD